MDSTRLRTVALVAATITILGAMGTLLGIVAGEPLSRFWQVADQVMIIIWMGVWIYGLASDPFERLLRLTRERARDLENRVAQAEHAAQVLDETAQTYDRLGQEVLAELNRARAEAIRGTLKMLRGAS